MRASGPSPSDGLNSTDYGCFTNEHNRLQPIWFAGSASPGRLVRAADNINAAESAAENDSDETIITATDNDILDTDDDPWLLTPTWTMKLIKMNYSNLRITTILNFGK